MTRMDRSIPRMIETNDGIKYYCSGCKEYHDGTEFYKNRNSTTGIDYKCKKFNREHYQNKPGIHIPWEENQIKLRDEILNDLGYCLQCDKSVHQQFLERHEKKLRKSVSFY